MKKIKTLVLATAIVALSTCSLFAQRGFGRRGGMGGGYHHWGYGARPYVGVVTVPYGNAYYGPNCGYVGYWHRWRCW